MAAEPASLFAAQEVAAPEFRPGNLATKFLQPPFTVLDTRKGDWQERRRAWLSLGIKSELGRGEDLLSLSPAEHARKRWTYGKGGNGTDLAGPMRASVMRSGEGRELVPGKGNARSDYGAYDTNVEEGASGGTSIFDPVLCELAYRWWAPEGGAILDPFAGGSVRGLVAAKLGHPYTGIDLSSTQLEANRRQAGQILGPTEPMPTWLHGDSRRLEELLPAGELYDLVFSCPPYYDLEVYGDDPADLSTAETYEEFLEGYTEVIARAAARLRPERFLVLVVSEIRDPAGYCRGLVPDTVAAGRQAGLHLYNEAVLVNSAGSLPLRVTKYMEASRKLGRAHQNVLCFIKGKPPRGWSYDRAAPPSPQLGLGLEEEGAPAAAVLAALPTLTAEPPAAARWPATDALPESLQEGTLAWVADVEGIPEPAELEPEVYTPEALTPVELCQGVWVKRDDLFEVASVRGGKVRTCWQLAQGATGLVTAGSRSSPQANIVAQVARELGIPARVHTPTGELSPELLAAQAAGAEVVQHQAGYNSVIIARARDDAAERGWVNVPFGMECEEAVARTAAQVANVPEEARRIVVPVGSGMSLAGILHGLELAGRELPVLGVVVGADPSKRLDRWAPEGWRERVGLVPSGSDYHTPAATTSWWGLELDAHYEAKAAAHCRPGDLLWVVGLRQSQAPAPELLGPSQRATGQDATEEPAPVLTGAGAESAAPGPSEGHLLEVEGGRLADPATGELFEATGEPVPPLEPVPEVPAITTAHWGEIHPSDEWACAGCGQRPTYPLQATVIPTMARGECDNCGREKVYTRRALEPVVITLTEEEVATAVARAALVVADDTAAGWQVKFDTGDETRLGINERGFGAELAAARATGLVWNDAYLPDNYQRKDKPPDIGRRVEVRNAIKPTGCLWADKRERRDWVYLLVTGSLPTYTVVGWLEGRDLMRPDRWREPPAVRYPGYFADQPSLRPLPLPEDA